MRRELIEGLTPGLEKHRAARNAERALQAAAEVVLNAAAGTEAVQQAEQVVADAERAAEAARIDARRQRQLELRREKAAEIMPVFLQLTERASLLIDYFGSDKQAAELMAPRGKGYAWRVSKPKIVAEQDDFRQDLILLTMHRKAQRFSPKEPRYVGFDARLLDISGTASNEKVISKQHKGLWLSDEGIFSNNNGPEMKDIRLVVPRIEEVITVLEAIKEQDK